jgi:hypothetical protein
MVNGRNAWRALALVGGTLVVAACGGDDGTVEAAPPAEAAAASPAESSAVASSSVAPATDQANACPIDGCTIQISDVERVGGELSVTFATNFDPDVSRNHIHIYWDTYTADEVSNDAAARGVEQGRWVPTAVVESFVTEGDVAMAERGSSTTVCVTAGDRNHDVIDSALVDCRDVADLVAD